MLVHTTTILYVPQSSQPGGGMWEAVGRTSHVKRYSISQIRNTHNTPSDTTPPSSWIPNKVYILMTPHCWRHEFLTWVPPWTPFQSARCSWEEQKMKVSAMVDLLWFCHRLHFQSACAHYKYGLRFVVGRVLDIWIFFFMRNSRMGWRDTSSEFVGFGWRWFHGYWESTMATGDLYHTHMLWRELGVLPDLQRLVMIGFLV